MSIYRYNMTAVGKLAKVRTRTHLELWAEDLGIWRANRDTTDLLDAILRAEREDPKSNMGDSATARECQGWAAKDIVRAIEPDRKGQWSPWGTL